jgi:hypothetical protein
MAAVPSVSTSVAVLASLVLVPALAHGQLASPDAGTPPSGDGSAATLEPAPAGCW